MVKIKLKDGSELSFENGVLPIEIAKKLSSSLAKKCVVAKAAGELIGLKEPLNDFEGELLLLTDQDPESFEVLNHSTAHLLAHAVKRLYPNAKFGVGPAIEEGFYYDFDLGEKIVPSDLLKIEKEMKHIVKQNINISHSVISKSEALEKVKGDKYKTELVNAIPDNEDVNLYVQDDYFDICRGPHVLSTGKIKNFKLLSIAGAYWRGDSNNEQLTRIYGTSFFSADALNEHLQNLEDRKLRDHRKLGKEMGLFMMSEFGPGFPFWLPNGMTLRNILENFWTKEHVKAGYNFIKTPTMLNKELWEISGHWFNYRENMYTSTIDDTEFAIKPMNCPGCMLVYKNDIHSYKEFPLRMAELGLVHRHEASGALNGLFRVRTFTQDDAHVFMTEDQISDEIANIILLFKKFYDIFNLKFNIELSTRPLKKFIGEVAVWDRSEKALAEACDKAGFAYTINPGDGAFYGPKLDFKLRDSMNRIWQCGTIQLDMNLPERFELTYIDKDGSKKRPVMVHRALFGSIERFIGILIEHYAGNFPVWLSPVQAKILPVNNAYHLDYVKELEKLFLDEEVRFETDKRDEKLGYRIREAHNSHVPYMLVIGDNERDNGLVTYRRHGEQKQTTVTKEEFVALIKAHNKNLN